MTGTPPSWLKRASARLISLALDLLTGRTIWSLVVRLVRAGARLAEMERTGLGRWNLVFMLLALIMVIVVILVCSFALDPWPRYHPDGWAIFFALAVVFLAALACPRVILEGIRHGISL